MLAASMICQASCWGRFWCPCPTIWCSTSRRNLIKQRLGAQTKPGGERPNAPAYPLKGVRRRKSSATSSKVNRASHLPRLRELRRSEERRVGKEWCVRGTPEPRKRYNRCYTDGNYIGGGY